VEVIQNAWEQWKCIKIVVRKSIIYLIICTTGFNINKLFILPPEYIYIISVFLRINSDYSQKSINVCIFNLYAVCSLP
jgi:hypothetical protein